MNWNNLKKNKCPKCNADICQSTMQSHSFECSNGVSCGFTISKEKFRTIVANQVNRKIAEDSIQIGENDFI